MSSPATLLPPRIVWSCLVGTVLAYLGLLHLLVPSGVSPHAPARLAGLSLLMAALAAVQTLAALGLLTYWHRGARATQKPPVFRYWQWLVCWGLVESIASYGLIVGMLEGSRHTATLLVVWSVLFLLLLRPPDPVTSPR